MAAMTSGSHPQGDPAETVLTPRGLSDCFTPLATAVYTLVIFLLNILAGAAIEYGSVFNEITTMILNGFDVALVVGFVATTIFVIVANLTGRDHLRHRALVVYLFVATLQTIAAVGALIVTARAQ